MQRVARTTMVLLLQTLLISGVALAGEKGARDEAVAMVKKAITSVIEAAAPAAYAKTARRDPLADLEI